MRKEITVGRSHGKMEGQEETHRVLHIMSNFARREVHAKLRQRSNALMEEKVPCWFVPDEGRKLLDKDKEMYLVKSLTEL